ncbi:MAG: glycosyltransferase, partial [Chitinophagales bacterium]|nr:glycosyltransferase [Chitinophagales bacterium]
MQNPKPLEILIAKRVKFHKISILVPAYNEGKTVTTVLEALSKVKLINDLAREVVVVDDGSKDNTVEVVKKFIEDNPA